MKELMKGYGEYELEDWWGEIMRIVKEEADGKVDKPKRHQVVVGKTKDGKRNRVSSWETPWDTDIMDDTYYPEVTTYKGRWRQPNYTNFYPMRDGTFIKGRRWTIERNLTDMRYKDTKTWVKQSRRGIEDDSKV